MNDIIHLLAKIIVAMIIALIVIVAFTLAQIARSPYDGWKKANKWLSQNAHFFSEDPKNTTS